MQALAAPLLLCAACAASPSQPPDTTDARARAEQWFSSAQELAREGQSVRAEQYFLAAVDAGIDWERVFPELVELCIRSGRLRSALLYVDRARRLQPEEPELLRLEASLHAALGQERAAAQAAEALAELGPLPADTWLFLAELALEWEEPERARQHFERFLALAPEAEEAAWARLTLRRLEVGQAGAGGQP